jgi:hypothetical protein
LDKLTIGDLFSLEQYARRRNDFRAQVLEHKRLRRLAVGPNLTWCFEDRMTVQYQVQEMLRVERIFEPEGITGELESYNPLIPDGHNWKVTLLIEYPDPEERRQRLEALKGVEGRCWIEARGFPRVFAIADEDLERENEEKTSAVHFLRFELTPAMIAALRAEAPLSIGTDHPQYRYAIEPVPADVRAALVADFT